MSRPPRLRDSRRLITEEPFALNEIPEDVIIKIGGYFVYLMYTGRKDITGTDWGDALASATGGQHLDSPLGIADVTLGRLAWSAKTVKNNNPFTSKTVRLISGRCSPDYSYGITDVHQDIQRTGEAVLGIWNERVNIAYDHFNPVRTSILIRSPDMLSYVLFEEENHRYRTSDYRWEENKNGNLIGINIKTNETVFTWQPHGSQFTIHTQVPENAIKFQIKQPPILTQEAILKTIDFDPSWVTIINS